MSEELIAVVPTLGVDTLPDALAALHADRPAMPIRVVLQGDRRPVLERVRARADLRAARLEWIVVERPIGFAAAVNLGLAGVAAPWIAVVNDDAEVGAGWSAELLRSLAAAPALAAAQGRNLLAVSGAIDGEGIAWNRQWQAAQIGHGEPAPVVTAGAAAIEVFGVAATAAIFCRQALDGLLRRDGVIFEERLGSYYEDVELAIRLRRDGWGAASVPSATARHHGSHTAGGSLQRWIWVYGNRWLVLARLLGGSFSRARPVALRRDLRDAAAALARGDVVRVLAVAGGLGRAARRWRYFAHRGAPLVDVALLARFGAPPIPAITPALPRRTRERRE